MKKYFLLIFLSSAVLAQDLKRPTSDTATAAAGCQTANTQAAPLAYDNAGLSTSSTIGQGGSLHCNQFGCTGSATSSSRVFKVWQAGGANYNSLTLNINSSASNTHNAAGAATGLIFYSIDSGATWTLAMQDTGAGWTQQTTTVTLSPTQDLSKLQVAVCLGGGGDGPSRTVSAEAISLFDIFTLADGGNSNNGNGSSSGIRHNPVTIN